MAVHLITGYKGTEHIQSKDARSFNAAMFGAGEFVMEIGNQLEASIINNNTVRVLDGDILMQGGHIRIETDTHEDMTITTGTAGKNRNDLIVMTYEKNSSDGTENAYLEVLKGTEVDGTASDPEHVSGTIAEGALKNQMPLYRVKVVGVVLSEIEALFTTIPTYKTLAEQYAAQFQAACNTFLGSLNILDTREEIEANTQANQLAGALGVKEISEELNQLNSNLKNIDTLETYLTDETVIGTWIDGKPIYRKFVYTGQNVDSIKDVSTLNIGVLVKIGGFAHYSANGAWFPVQYKDNENFCALWYDTTNKALKAVGSKTAENAYIWLEYTKTTD